MGATLQMIIHAKRFPHTHGEQEMANSQCYDWLVVRLFLTFLISLNVNTAD
jgi:hypothetical protein